MRDSKKWGGGLGLVEVGGSVGAVQVSGNLELAVIPPVLKKPCTVFLIKI